MRRLFIALAAVCALAAPALAQEAHPPEPHAYSFDSPLGGYDIAQLQRGFQVYAQICAGCHSMDHLSYRNLGEPGGPFEEVWQRNEQTGEEERVLKNIATGEHLRPVSINDNQSVRAIAENFQIPDINRETGEEETRPGRISDRFHRPFANEIVARASNNGALPPDFSSIVSARHGGAHYVRSLLMGYTGEERDGKYVNPYFAGGIIAMPPPLLDGAITFDNGPEATVEQMATDVAAFLQWTSDPHMVERKKTGVMVVAFLFILSLLLYVSYKTVWRGQKH